MENNIASMQDFHAARIEPTSQKRDQSRHNRRRFQEEMREENSAKEKGGDPGRKKAPRASQSTTSQISPPAPVPDAPLDAAAGNKAGEKPQIIDYEA